MKLILQTSPHFFVEEDKILATLFDEGLDLLLLRKPGTEPIYSERLLTLLPEKYHDRVIVHDHFYLKDEFNLLGIHLNKANPIPPSNYNGGIQERVHLRFTQEYLRQYFPTCQQSRLHSRATGGGYSTWNHRQGSDGSGRHLARKHSRDQETRIWGRHREW